MFFNRSASSCCCLASTTQQALETGSPTAAPPDPNLPPQDATTKVSYNDAGTQMTPMEPTLPYAAPILYL
jgi:hypothetical protein